MEAVSLLVRAQLRRQWLAWLALSIAIGLVAGAAITAAAGVHGRHSGGRRGIPAGHRRDGATPPG
jgi:hypothetical protein